MRVSANLTDLVGVSPILGRAFRDEEDAPGQNQVALLGYSLWQRQFGGDAGVIGRVVHMNGLPFTVIGVKSLLYEVQPIDPTTMVVVTAVLEVVALIAAIVPARRAARVDPVVALRAE